MDGSGIAEALRRLQVPHDRIAATIGRDRTAATKLVNGARRVQPTEVEPLLTLIAEWQRERDPYGLPPARPSPVGSETAGEYLAVEVVPIFREEPPTRMLVHREVLARIGARPENVRLIRHRGPAMEPEFRNGDVLLIDLRDRSTAQAGPFAIWTGADEYAVRNLQALPGGRIRVSAANPAFPPVEVDADELRIMGRPVWATRFL